MFSRYFIRGFMYSQIFSQMTLLRCVEINLSTSFGRKTFLVKYLELSVFLCDELEESHD